MATPVSGTVSFERDGDVDEVERAQALARPISCTRTLSTFEELQDLSMSCSSPCRWT